MLQKQIWRLAVSNPFVIFSRKTKPYTAIGEDIHIDWFHHYNYYAAKQRDLIVTVPLPCGNRVNDVSKTSMAPWCFETIRDLFEKQTPALLSWRIYISIDFMLTFSTELYER